MVSQLTRVSSGAAGVHDVRHVVRLRRVREDHLVLLVTDLLHVREGDQLDAELLAHGDVGLRERVLDVVVLRVGVELDDVRDALALRECLEQIRQLLLRHADHADVTVVDDELDGVLTQRSVQGDHAKVLGVQTEGGDDPLEKEKTNSAGNSVSHQNIRLTSSLPATVSLHSPPHGWS